MNLAEFILGFAVGWSVGTLVLVFLVAKWDLRWPDGSRYGRPRRRK